MAVTLKTCLRCEEKKELNEFGKDKYKEDGRCIYCRTCIREKGITYYASHKELCTQATVKWREKNRERYLAYHRKESKESQRVRRHRYADFGITIEDYDDMYIQQGGCCATCGIHQSELDSRLAVDHCHDTSVVRGLLCKRCNQGIGLFNDDTELFGNIIKYLERKGG